MSSLREEIHKTEPFECPEQEALLNLFRTSDRLNHRFAQLFSEHGLTCSQYNILRILRGEGTPLPCLEIAQRTITVVPGITGLIDRLEQKALVQRQRCNKDRRVIYVSVTSAGLDLLAKIDAPLVALHRRLLAHLTPAEVVELSRLLEKARGTAVASTDEASPCE